LNLANSNKRLHSPEDAANYLSISQNILRAGLVEASDQVLESLLDAKEVKRLLRCSLALVYNLADRGQIPCIRIPCPGSGKPKSLLRFKRIDVIQFIERHYQT
jgi:Helix-turn-helix domain